MKVHVGLFSALILLTVTACRGRERAESILPDGCSLQLGDVVFRRCTGLNSEIVIRRDTGGIFSHVGIVADSAGTLMVVHAVPGEPDFKGDPDRVKMERPEKFYAAGRTVAGAICRPLQDDVAHKAAEKAVEVFRRGTLFDHQYDDEDTTRMYCTELIVHCFRSAGVELVGPQRHVVSLPLMHYRCILPSQVYKSSYLKPISLFYP